MFAVGLLLWPAEMKLDLYCVAEYTPVKYIPVRPCPLSNGNV